MTKSISLSQGKFALVDDELFDELNKFKWYFHDGYAVRSEGKNSPKIRMHRFILKTPEGMYTDHINGDKLNNRLSNLRPCTSRQNVQNRSAQANNSSGFKGVSWNKQNKKFAVMINIDKKRTHLGYYETAEKAARVYDAYALAHYGEFARLNFEVKP